MGMAWPFNEDDDPVTRALKGLQGVAASVGSAFGAGPAGTMTVSGPFDPNAPEAQPPPVAPPAGGGVPPAPLQAAPPPPVPSAAPTPSLPPSGSLWSFATPTPAPPPVPAATPELPADWQRPATPTTIAPTPQVSDQPSLGERVAQAAKPVWDTTGAVLGHLYDDSPIPRLAQSASDLVSTPIAPLAPSGSPQRAVLSSLGVNPDTTSVADLPGKIGAWSDAGLAAPIAPPGSALDAIIKATAFANPLSLTAPGGPMGLVYQTARSLPQTVPQVPGVARAAWDEAVDSVKEVAPEVLSALGRHDPAAALWGGARLGMDVANLPFNVAQRSVNTLAPAYGLDTPFGRIGLGDTLMAAQMAHDVFRLAQAGIRVGPEVVAALKNGTAVEDLLQGAARSLDQGNFLRGLGQGSPEAVARAADYAEQYRQRAGLPPLATTGADGTGLGAPSSAGLPASSVDLGAAQRAMAGFVPPEVRARLVPQVELPDDPRFAAAVAAHGGRITPEGAEVYVTRAQGPSAAGARATRGGVFEEAVPEGGQSGYANNITDDPTRVGGTQVLPPTLTTYRKPLLLDSEPGSSSGFDQTMERLGGAKPPQVVEAERAVIQARDEERAAYDARHAALQAYYDRFPPDQIGSGEATGTAFFATPAGRAATDAADAATQRLSEAAARLREVRDDFPETSNETIEEGLNSAHLTSLPGTPYRAQLLKELVTQHGGDPSLIDDLLAVRGSEARESQWAIKENIAAARARQAGHDSIWTLQDDVNAARAARRAQIEAHPDYQALVPEANAARRAQADAMDAARDAAEQYGVNSPEGLAGYEAYQSSRTRSGAAQRALQDVQARLENQIPLEPRARIKEIFDVQQGRNPTPGPPDQPTLERAQGELDALMARRRQLVRQLGGPRADYNYDAFLATQAAPIADEGARIVQRADELRGEIARAQQTRPSYALHPDLQARYDASKTSRELYDDYQALHQQWSAADTSEEADALYAQMQQLQRRLIDTRREERDAELTGRGLQAALPDEEPPPRGEPPAEGVPLRGEGDPLPFEAGAPEPSTPVAQLPKGSRIYARPGSGVETSRTRDTVPAALEASEHQPFVQAAQAIMDGGDTSHLPVEWHPLRVTLNRGNPQFDGVHHVDLPFFRTQGGRLIPLPPADPGIMGSPVNSAYSKAVAAAGGRKGFPFGAWRAADGSLHPFDSPQETVFMQHYDQLKQDGQVVNWWRGDNNPRDDLKAIPYVSTNRDKGGIREYRPDFIVQHNDGSVEVIEAKPAKVIASQEEYGIKAGQTTGKMGWDVAKKAAGVIAGLADRGASYRLMLERDAAPMIPLGPNKAGKGMATKRLDLLPGLDPRDVPAMRAKTISPNANSPGNTVADVIHDVSLQAVAMANDLKAQGVPEQERLEQLTRFVRERVLETGNQLGREEGQTHLMDVGGQAELGSWVSHRGPLTLDELAEHDPDAAAHLRDMIERGATPGQISIHGLTDANGVERPHLVFSGSGDPQLAQRAAAAIGVEGGRPSGFWYHDAKGPYTATTAAIERAPGMPEPDFEAIRQAATGGSSEAPTLLPRYNSAGRLDGIHVIGRAADGTVLSENDVAAVAVRARQALERQGHGLSSGPLKKAEVSSFAGEAGHATSQQAGLQRTEQILGIRPITAEDIAAQQAERAARVAAERGRVRAGAGGTGADAEAAAGGDAAGVGGLGRDRSPLDEAAELDDDFVDPEDLADEGAGLSGALPSGLTATSTATARSGPQPAPRVPGVVESAARAAAPTRAVLGGAAGASAGGAAGYESSPEDASPLETAARTLGGASAGGIAGAALAGAGTLAAGRLVDSLVSRGAIDAKLLASHPETADRIRALYALAAHGLPDDAVVEQPAMVSAIRRMRPRIAEQVSDLTAGPVTAGDVRQMVGAADSPSVAQTLSGMAIDALTGLGARARRGRETAADAATVRGIANEARRSTAGRIAETTPGLATPDGRARLVDPERQPNLTSFVNDLADRLGVPRPGLYLVDSPRVNASATSDAGPSALVVTRGLLESGLTDDEMEAVLTHELAHTLQDSRSLAGRALSGAQDALGSASSALSSVPGALARAVGEGASALHRATPDGMPGAGLWWSKPDGQPFSPQEMSEAQAALAKRGILAHPSEDGTHLTIPAHQGGDAIIPHVQAAAQEVGHAPQEALTSYSGETRPRAAASDLAPAEPAGVAGGGDTAGPAERSQVPGLSADAGGRDLSGRDLSPAARGSGRDPAVAAAAGDGPSYGPEAATAADLGAGQAGLPPDEPVGPLPPARDLQGALPPAPTPAAATPSQQQQQAAPPGAQAAIAKLPSAAQQAIARAQANQPPGLSPLEWMRRFAGTAGYSSMIGPATFSVNVLGNLMEPMWAHPKELTRALMRGAPGEYGQYAAGVFSGGVANGMRKLYGAIMDAAAGRGAYANPNALSNQTINPFGKRLAQGLEAGGRVFSAMPDAVFGTIATGAGEARRAAQLATDSGLKGQAWRQHVAALLQDVEDVKSGQLPSLSSTQDVIDSGAAYAKRQTFQDDLGKYGKNVENFATAGHMPVVGSLLTPFFKTPWNMNLRMLERSPAGFALNSQGSRFDKAYDATLGTAMLLGIGMGPVADGTITGGGPQDPQKRAEMRAQGWRPYSTLVGGAYVPNRTFGVYAPILNAAADVHDAIVFSKKGDAASIVNDYAGRLGQQIQQQPYLQGLSSLMQTLQAGQGGGLTGAATNYAASTLTRMVPYASTARAIGTALDPSERTIDRGPNVSAATTLGEQVRSGVGNRQGFAGLGQQPLPVAQNVLGQAQTNPQQGSAALFAKTSPLQDAPVAAAFLKSGVDIPPPRNAITIGGNKLDLSEDEQRHWNAVRGEMLSRLMGPLLASSSLDRLPAGARDQMLRGFLSTAAQFADTQVFVAMEPVDRNQRVRDAITTSLQKAS